MSRRPLDWGMIAMVGLVALFALVDITILVWAIVDRPALLQALGKVE